MTPGMPMRRLRQAPGHPPSCSGIDIAVVSKLLHHASIAIIADVHDRLVGTIAQKVVDGAANLIAHSRRWTPDAGFNLSG
jgi:hypothetical protein